MLKYFFIFFFFVTLQANWLKIKLFFWPEFLLEVDKQLNIKTFVMRKLLFFLVALFVSLGV